MGPRLLAFDTSTEQMAVALGDGPRGWPRDEPGGAQASARLLPLVDELLAQAGIAYADLDGIAFGRGPGAFTGLRTSCAVAQGLGFGLGKPVLALDSLMLVAEDTRAVTGADDIWVAMDARMDEVYAGRYRRVHGQWQVAEAPRLYTLPALRARWVAAAPALCCGSAIPAFGERLGLDALPTHAAPGSRAAALLRLACERWPLGEAGAAADALPLYLRDKVALTTDERAALRAAAA